MKKEYYIDIENGNMGERRYLHVAPDNGYTDASTLRDGKEKDLHVLELSFSEFYTMWYTMNTKDRIAVAKELLDIDRPTITLEVYNNDSE